MSEQQTPERSKKRRKWPWITALAAVAIILIAIFASGKGGNGPATTGAPAGNDTSAANPPAAKADQHTVVYKVTGTAKKAFIAYSTDGAATSNQETQKLPWQKTITLPANKFALVSLNAASADPIETTDNTTVDVLIEVDGKSFKEAHAVGVGWAFASGTLTE